MRRKQDLTAARFGSRGASHRGTRLGLASLCPLDEGNPRAQRTMSGQNSKSAMRGTGGAALASEPVLGPSSRRDGLTLGVGLPPLVFQKAAVSGTENCHWPMRAAPPGRRGAVAGYKSSRSLSPPETHERLPAVGVHVSIFFSRMGPETGTKHPCLV